MRLFYSSSMAVALIVGLADAAHAQQTGVATPSESSSKSVPEGSGEIVVTAQKRSERAIDVPQTVNLVSARELSESGVNTTDGLSQLVPGLTFTPSGLAQGQPTLRGVGTSITNVGSSSTVATYIDGVYQLAQSGSNFDLSNIQKVEVLKGPQGTLYGRNATGGVILITTTDPSFTAHGSASIGYGNFNAISSDVYLTGPITDKIAGDVALNYNSDDGYYHDIYRHQTIGGVTEYGIRGKLLYRLSEQVRLVFSIVHNYDSDPTDFDAAPLNENSVARATPGVILPTKPYDVALDFSPIIRNSYTQGSVTADVDTDKVHFTSISAANVNQLNFYADTDFSPLNLSATRESFDERITSQEFNLSSNGVQPLSWIGGLLYVHQYGSVIYPATATSTITGTTTNDSYSGFLELTYRLTPRLSVVGGARYTYEDLAYDGATNGVAAADAKSKSSVWTPRVSVNYALTDDTKVYATFSQGFRSGGWNATALSDTPYLPEHVTAYEVGIKSNPLPRLNLSAALFDYDFRDVQFQSTELINGVYKTAIYNAAHVESYGAELDASWRLTSALTLNGGFGYTHARYTSFLDALVTTPKATGGNTQGPENVSGNTVIRTPEETINFGATYAVNVDYGRLELSGNAAYSSRFYFDPGNRLSQGGYMLGNARLAFTPRNQPYQVALWVKNITGRTVVASVTDSTLGDRAIYNVPRTYGVTLSAKF